MGKVGTKRSDHRWRAPDGTVWDSKFEWRVYDDLRRAGIAVRKCSERDSISYSTKVRSGRCVACGGGTVVQDRSYTPDLHVWQGPGDGDGIWLEVKGHMQPSRRSQLREVVKQNPELDLRFILYSANTKATKKLRLWEYIEKYLKRPVIVWQGEFPNEWQQG